MFLLFSLVLVGLALWVLLRGFVSIAIMLVAAVLILACTYLPWQIGDIWYGLLWIGWWVILLAILFYFSKTILIAAAMVAAVVVVAAMTGVGAGLSGSTDTTEKVLPTVSATNPETGETESQYYAANQEDEDGSDAGTPDKPLSGEAATTNEAINPTLTCDPDTALNDCIDQSGERGERAEVAFKAVGLDTDSSQNQYDYVVVINSPNTSADSARNMVKAYVKDNADVLYFNDAAVVNSYTDSNGNLHWFRDARSQVRPLNVSAESKAEADKKAKQLIGYFKDCFNAVRGIFNKPQPEQIVEKPIPIKTPEKPEKEKTPSETTSTTTSPTSSSTTTSPTPSETTSTTTTPPEETTTTPPETTPPCPPWENGHVPPRNEDDTCPKDPGAGPEAPDDHTLAPAPTGEPDTVEPTETETANPTDEPGDPEPSIQVPNTPSPTSTTQEETETEEPPAPVKPTHTEDPSPEVTPTDDPPPPPFGEETSNASVINGIGSLMAIGAVLFFIWTRKRYHGQYR